MWLRKYSTEVGSCTKKLKLNRIINIQSEYRHVYEESGSWETKKRNYFCRFSRYVYRHRKGRIGLQYGVISHLHRGERFHDVNFAFFANWLEESNVPWCPECMQDPRAAMALLRKLNG